MQRYWCIKHEREENACEVPRIKGEAKGKRVEKDSDWSLCSGQAMSVYARAGQTEIGG